MTTLTSQKRWELAPRIPASFQHKNSHLHPILLQVLYTRGLTEPAQIQAFLEQRYTASTDPFLLPDMDKAVQRIQRAIEQEERVIVYGDFDADGVTSTVLLTEALRGLGLPRRQAQPYIPDRIDEGYGLNMEAISKIKEELEADLVISVDCGIRSVAEVEHANNIGLDIIITDHHSVGPSLPPALAVINPKRPENQYPERMLAGVGIAFKLAQALKQAMPDRATFTDEQLLDLVALGTVADLAPLMGENRQLVIRGLEVLNKAERPGIAALAKVSAITPGQMTAETIGFGLGPRINAAGRLAHAYDAAKVLASNNYLMAHQYAIKLNHLNKDRQRYTADLTRRAEEQVNPEANILIAADSAFLPGVVGLVASRLAEQNYRPAIVFEVGEEESRASCRSIPEFHITKALDQVAELLERHGGHAQAAGLTIRNENMPAFIERITAIADEHLADKTLVPSITIDAEITLEQVDWSLHGHLQQLEPTGFANPTPIFMSRGVEVVSHRAVGADGDHLQLRLQAGEVGGRHDRLMAGIAFRQGAWANHMPTYIDVVYTIGVNEWNGRRNLQLMVQDLRPSDATASL